MKDMIVPAAGRGLLALALAWAVASALAQEASFFAGRKIQLVVGFDVGGGYDLYARTVARHLTNHIPAQPTFVPQNMPGAGSRTAGNWLYNWRRRTARPSARSCRARRSIRRCRSRASGSMRRSSTGSAI
jgi:hypothetical protein